jgi:diaminopimelate epimerase
VSGRPFVLIEAAGNRFALADGFAEPPPDDAAGIARALAGRVDGLLLLDPPSGNGPVAVGAEGELAVRTRMTLYNADGSRAEACGNGLRCIAAIAVEEGHVPAAPFAIETDAGPRSMEVEVEHGRVVRARAGMGPIALGEPFVFEHAGTAHDVYPADAGNPHAVVFVADVAATDLEDLGPALEHHQRFPHRTNVEIANRVNPSPGLGLIGFAGIDVRVWERGVGETAACGTGACAAACVAAARLGLAPPIDVRMPGGLLQVSWSDLGSVHLAGPVRRLGIIRV